MNKFWCYGFLILIMMLSGVVVLAQDATPEATPEAAALGTAADLEVTDAEVEAAKTVLGDKGFIGIIACTFSTEYHFTVADSARQRAEALGLKVEMVDSEINVEKQISAIENLTASGANV